VQWVPGLYRG